MEWQKRPESLVRVFGEALPDDPRLERRKMFGYPCAFVGGNLFAGLHAASVIMRLPEDARARLLAMEGAGIFEPMPGRPMREYVVAPPTVVADPATLGEWLLEAFAHATTLPPKTKEKPAGTAAKRRTGDAGSATRRRSGR